MTPARRRIVAEDVDAILAAELPWGDLDNRTVLISGANGFLAAYLVEVLLGMRERLGVGPRRVIGLVRSAGRARRRFAHHADRADLAIVEHDLAAPVRIDGAIDHVIHAASPASPLFYLTDPVGVIEANVAGTRTLLAVAREKGSRFLLFSSGEVYGQATRIPTAEGDYGYLDPATVRACYGESKRLAETMTLAWEHQYGMHASIVRPFHTYGPGVALDDGRVFADFVADIVRGRDIVLKSDGSARRAFCYIADATLGFLAVLLRGQGGTPYNIGDPDGEISIRDLAELLVALFPERGLRAVTDIASRPADYSPSPVARNAPDIGRARALGWHPRTSISEGFRRMVLSYE